MSDKPIQGRLLLLGATAEVLEPYLRAAEKLAVATVCGVEAANASGDALPLVFAQRDSALAIVQYALEHPLAGMVAADEQSAPSCARAASMIGLRAHPPKAADACLEKFALRQKLSNAGFRSPLLGDAPAGRDIAVAALLDGGRMRVLGTIEDREVAVDVRRRALELGLRAARSVGLFHGPLWLKLRLAGEETWIIDIAAAIPVQAAAPLQFKIPLVDEEVSLAEVIVRHALGVDVTRVCRK
ncbi:MAG: hypothetical protein ACE14L_00535 [Terriglobales bacterium]